MERQVEANGTPKREFKCPKTVEMTYVQLKYGNIAPTNLLTAKMLIYSNV